MSGDAVAIAEAVRAGRVRARDVAAAALERIGKRDGTINAFTAVTTGAAQRDAERIDASVAAGVDPGPLAGVPFAVKNLFDVGGLVTLAGSRINADRPPAERDAVVVAALRRAGAVLVGALNMDEYAYGFTTENSHYGPTRNPHDLTRVAGGSSGGSGAAVAAGLVPIALGSDTNGSIRVPSALCGVFGLKPTYGRVSRTGTALFSASLDHVGPLARSLRDTAAAFDVMQGPDAEDPVSSSRAPEPCLPHIDEGIAGIRIAVAGGHFARGGDPEALAGVEAAAGALGVERRVELPEAHRARAAAMTITAAEGAHLHAADLRSRAADFDQRTRGRFLAGALIPAAYYLQAQRFRAWYREEVRALFREVDVILAPTTPWAATRIGEDAITVGGQQTLIRPNFGLYTQPISFIGLPVLAAPIAQPGAWPRGIQIIGAPFSEVLLFRVAAVLQDMGVVGATLAEGAHG